jgi:hypothetical protein
MSKKLLIWMLSGIAISGAVFLGLKKLLGLPAERLCLSPASAPVVDLLREKNFGEFPVEIPEDEFEGWGV